VVSLLAELRGHERQAAEELERWKTGAEERKPLDASPTAITLALLPTDEELDSLEKRAGDGEIAGRGRTGGSDVASPQPAVRHGEPARVFLANAAPPTGDRGSGVICGALQKCWDRLRASLDLILQQRGADWSPSPVAPAGCFAGTTRARKPTNSSRGSTPAWSRWSPNCAAMSGRPTSEELGQWKARVGERKPLDAAPAAITLAMLMTPRGAEMANVPGARPSRNCSSGRRTSRSNPRRLAGGDHARLDPRRGKGSFPILQGRRAQVQPWIRNTGESADWLQASAITGCHGHFAPGILLVAVGSGRAQR
jgi:hypothetical protein